MRRGGGWRRLQTASFHSVSVPRLQQLCRFALFPDPQPLPSHYRKSVGPLGSTRKCRWPCASAGQVQARLRRHIDVLDFSQFRARIFDGRYAAVGCNSASLQRNALVGAPIITAQSSQRSTLILLTEYTLCACAGAGHGQLLMSQRLAVAVI